MDQKPMQGLDPLDPPTPEIARLYLDEVDAVRERRDAQIDLRSQGTGTLIVAVVIFLFVTCNIALVRSGDTSAVPLFLLLMVGATQIISGATERGGAQRRFTRGRWLYYGAVAVCVLGILVSTVMYLALGEESSFVLVAAPAWLACLILASIGVVQLWSSRHASPHPSRAAASFEKPARVTTLILGLILAAAIAATGIGDPLLTSTLGVIAGAALITVSIAAASDWGLGTLGEVWRWPQHLVFGVGALCLAGLALVPLAGFEIAPAVWLAVAGVVAVGVLVVSLPLRARAGRRG